MATTTTGARTDLRIAPEEVISHQERGEPMLTLDVRSPGSWNEGEDQIAGAERRTPDGFAPDPGWDKEGLILLYCT